ncbi:siroheme decarboxylase subunit beta [Flexibacterium corallicola]|uniref:siroheme decarboxylase subunit beta n=1 Tax=Flexibacterium corallicola TaxID=3037259 RepID=UPI00286F4972|nr:AsnC family transcriptional regulator [Pseudovibrio sp. M1P-2-3]
MTLSELDRKIIEATQAGLPLVAAPYEAIAKTVGLTEAIVLERLEAMQAQGVIRRIGAAPNHYRLGMTANGMSVWDVEDESVERLGKQVGALPFVTHCYRRPRALPAWPYNLFAMIHGSSREEVIDKQQEIADLLGASCKSNDILYSTRILKKTGLRLRKKEA